MLQNILVFSAYGLLIFYALARIVAWVKHSFELKPRTRNIINITACALFILAASTILLWMLFPQNDFSVTLLRTGNYWLGFFMEFITTLAVFDLVLLIVRRVRKKKNLGSLSPKFIRVYGIFILSISLLMTVGGVNNARYINVNDYDITVDKNAGSLKELNVVLIADTHMGYSVGCNHIKSVVDKINAQNPDLVIIAGDIFDNNFDALEDPDKLSSILREIEAKYGVYATYGNHDVDATLVGGFTVGGSRLRDPRMEQFLKKSNIKILYDDRVTIANDSIYLIGRIDGEEPGDGNDNQARMTIEELTAGLDYSKPIFVINHEPDELQSYADNYVDVLFCGHTHGGQTFPLNVPMLLVWKLSHGSMKIRNMYTFVTSGAGVYGPYMRLFTQCEVMDIHIHFQ